MSQWLPLVDYAVKKGVSLSTLRRQIKSNRVQHRLDKGKYFILDTEEIQDAFVMRSQDDVSALRDRVRDLEKALQKAREENSELKTLIALYEEQALTSSRSR